MIDEMMEDPPTQLTTMDSAQAALPPLPTLDFTALTSRLPALSDLGEVSVVFNTANVFSSNEGQLQQLMQLSKTTEGKFSALK